jgi:hypothetical protein
MAAKLTRNITGRAGSDLHHAAAHALQHGLHAIVDLPPPANPAEPPANMGLPLRPVMRPRRLMAALVVVALVAGAQLGCRRGPSELERRQAQERQRALDSCRRHQAVLPQRLERFTADRQALLALQGERYRPAPGPRPLDPQEQSRLTIYDQQSEQEQYEKALAAWQEREQGRRAAWRARQRQRLQQAEQRLAASAVELRAVSAELLDAAPVPSLRPEAVARHRDCRPEAFR